MTEEYRPEQLDVSEQIIKSVQKITGGSTYDVTEQLIVDGGFIREQVHGGATVWLKFLDGREMPVQFKPIQSAPLSNIIHFPKSPQNLPQNSE